jgi:hypothetical protein
MRPNQRPNAAPIPPRASRIAGRPMFKNRVQITIKIDNPYMSDIYMDHEPHGPPVSVHWL